MKIFSYKKRPCHLGPYPLETLPRLTQTEQPQISQRFEPIGYDAVDENDLNPAIGQYAAMLDVLRDGITKTERAVIPDALVERAHHIKSFAYFQDASQVGICHLKRQVLLDSPIENQNARNLAHQIQRQQTNTLASGIDVILHELRESVNRPLASIDHHTHAIVILTEFTRDPDTDEEGCDWIHRSQAQRAAVRTAETAVVLANYLRLLGFEARAHTASASDVNLSTLAVHAGLARYRSSFEDIANPYVGTRFGLSAITTTLAMHVDQVLAPPNTINRLKSHGLKWWLGYGFNKNRWNVFPFSRRRFVQGQYPFEKTKRQTTPTTLIDEPRVPRVPKRTDMFARALFGDMGPRVQAAAKNGNYVRKSPTSYAHRSVLASFVVLQDIAQKEQMGHPLNKNKRTKTDDTEKNAKNIKAALYFLGADAVGISRCPDWAYYSHDASGKKIKPQHTNAISVIVDQGHETMEGASGDDWIACAQSMRAYLRFALLGGIVAQQIRRLGYSAKAHTVMDGEVLQPPLLLLSGLGEVSRIGEVILNPYLGPRLKSGVITTDMPLAHDQPINFGLQHFCEQCNKCARECPSGAIAAGKKVMFNGYEIWKSDSQKCTTYRVSQTGGAMCGRCMKTCPWNLEGLFAEAPFRWLASHVPSMAKWVAKLDDTLGRGQINPNKKWWWDLEMIDNGPYSPPLHAINSRALNPDLKLNAKDQTLAVYPANLAPPPHPFPYPMNREEGISAFNALLSPQEYQMHLQSGEMENIAHQYRWHSETSGALEVFVSDVRKLGDEIYLYTLQAGEALPTFTAGAHIDVVVAPEYLRQYSLCNNPSDCSYYQIAVKTEAEGRGGSILLNNIFRLGRRIFISRPINHFPLDESAHDHYLMAGGIGVTPLMSMAYRLHDLGKTFYLHYSCRSTNSAAFREIIETQPWRQNVSFHISDQGTRIDLTVVIPNFVAGKKMYICGSEHYMNAVRHTALEKGWPEQAISQEYFTVPDTPEYQNHPFTIRLSQSQKTLSVSAEQTLAEVLIAAGIRLHVKCADGLCATCKCRYLEGDVEHRDFVLSQDQRKTEIITCQSRCAQKNGHLTLDL